MNLYTVSETHILRDGEPYYLREADLLDDAFAAQTAIDLTRASIPLILYSKKKIVRAIIALGLAAQLKAVLSSSPELSLLWDSYDVFESNDLQFVAALKSLGPALGVGEEALAGLLANCIHDQP